MEKSPAAENYPVAKVADSFLKDNLQSSPFSFPGWNSGRIVSQHSQLKRLLSEIEQSSNKSKTNELIKLSNTPLPLPVSRSSISSGGREKHSSANTDTLSRRQKDLTPSTV